MDAAKDWTSQAREIFCIFCMPFFRSRLHRNDPTWWWRPRSFTSYRAQWKIILCSKVACGRIFFTVQWSPHIWIDIIKCVYFFGNGNFCLAIVTAHCEGAGHKWCHSTLISFRQPLNTIAASIYPFKIIGISDKNFLWEFLIKFPRFG